MDSSGKVYVAEPVREAAFVYAAGSNGNVSPVATISGGSVE